MGEIIFILVVIIGILNSVFLLITDSNSYDALLEKHISIKIILYMTFLILLIVIPWQLGEVARSETSSLPWLVWTQESQKHGALNGILAVSINLFFLIWALIIPGHLYANNKKKKSGKRPVHPYFINLSVGIVLCFTNNFIYKAIMTLT